MFPPMMSIEETEKLIAFENNMGNVLVTVLIAMTKRRLILAPGLRSSPLWQRRYGDKSVRGLVTLHS